MRTGSPLMTPGLAMGPPFPRKATQNAVVAVASIEQPSVPMVVGVCEINIAALGQVQGSKGHAVRGEHWLGDELWLWSSSGKSWAEAPNSIEGWAQTGKQEELPAKIEQMSIEDDDPGDDGGVTLENGPQHPVKATPVKEYVEGEDGDLFEAVEEKDLTTKGWYQNLLLHIGPNLTRVQKSTTLSGRLSFMLYIISRTRTRMTKIMDCNSRSHNLFSCPTWCFHFYRRLLPSKRRLSRLRKRRGKIPRSS